jgi:hypothetical protein
MPVGFGSPRTGVRIRCGEHHPVADPVRLVGCATHRR